MVIRTEPVEIGTDKSAGLLTNIGIGREGEMTKARSQTPPRPLNLRPDCIESPVPWDSAGIDAAMACPDDEDRRIQLNNLLSIEVFATQDPNQYTKERLYETIRMALDIPFSRESMQKEMTTRCEHGIVAGLILLHTIRFSKLKGGPVSSDEIRKFVLNELNESMRVLRVTTSMSQVENVIWPNYRPAAHLWAAKAWLHSMNNPGDPIRTDLDWLRPFPVPLAELGYFLGLSEWFRKQGEQLRAHRSAVTVLIPGEAIVAPDSIRIPEIGVEFLPDTMN